MGAAISRKTGANEVQDSPKTVAEIVKPMPRTLNVATRGAKTRGKEHGWSSKKSESLSWLSTETLKAGAPTEQDQVLLDLKGDGGVQRTR